MFKIGDFSRLTQVSVKTLRYYDEIDLLKPAQIDRFTSYRYYTADQLPRLNRILALKDLGLSLDQITDLLKKELAPDQMQAILRQKRNEIARQLAEEQARLIRVEARLRQIEQEGKVSEYEVVIKPVPALRVAVVRYVVPSYAESHTLFSDLFCYLNDQGIDPNTTTPWMSLYYDEGYRESEVDMAAAAPVDRLLPDGDRAKVIELPAVEMMMSVVYHGPYEQMAPAYTALIKFAAANRFCIAGPNRNVYLYGPAQSSDPADYVTEIQFPAALDKTES